MVESVKSNVSKNVRKVTGNKGSHDSRTSKGRAANAGEEIGEKLKGGEKNINEKSDITYSSKKDGIDTDSGLNYADEVVKAADENGDGGITLDSEEKKKAEEGLGIEDLSVADDNADGVIDRAEYFSLTVLQDCHGNEADGVASAQEAKQLNESIRNDAESVKTEISNIIAGLDVNTANENYQDALTKEEKLAQIEDVLLQQDEKLNQLLEVSEEQSEEIEKLGQEVKAGNKQQQEAMAEIAKNMESLQLLTMLNIMAQQSGVPIQQLCQMYGINLDELMAKISKGGNNLPLNNLNQGLGLNTQNGLNFGTLTTNPNANFGMTTPGLTGAGFNTGFNAGLDMNMMNPYGSFDPYQEVRAFM